MLLIRIRYFVLIGAIFVSACSGLPVKEAAEQLRMAPVCCASYAELKFEMLSQNKLRKFNLDTSSPVMEFPEGRSYLASFVLPPSARSISIQSIPVGYLPETSYVDPVIVILDADKNNIARIVELDLRRSHNSFFGVLEWFFGGRISLPGNSKYIVIYANNNSRRVLLGISANGTRWPTPPAPIGELGLIVE